VIFQYLGKVKNIDFDLVFSTQPFTPSERDAQYQTALQMAQLVTQSGRPIGPATFNALIEMSNMPSKLATALKIDSMMPPTQPADPAGQNATLQGGGGGAANTPKPPANGDGASSGGGGGGPTPGKKSAAQEREE
jgi:hypothetical protein